MVNVARSSVLVGLLLIIAGLTFADNLAPSFKEAAARGEIQEHASSTSNYFANVLMPYYGNKYQSVLQSCFATVPNPDSGPFSFVVAIGLDGKPMRIYRDHDTNIFLCMRGSLEKDVFPKPPVSPYYLHIEMKFSAKSAPPDARPLSVNRDRSNCTFGVSAGWKDDCDQRLAQGTGLPDFPYDGIFEKSNAQFR
ncbi:MAG: hypothetical protein WA871_16200 [Candidatus Acidiferrales bacterium]